ncbi:MAG TPA: 50S ribosomal protein L13 [Candidatus Eremiobacteraeota bacterium]|nr:MAG: 50S ribosomal protein L13 [bacterium ADurb.Bin363]HPZ07530.1 50S ribosomal protein L13 [Candidatus Eremiobacteraeota bacterium]
MRTRFIKIKDEEKKWWIVDASDKTLGRLCTGIVRILTGKHKPVYSPNLDVGDRVIVVNAEKVRVTGNKTGDKVYYHHSGYPGGLKEISYNKLLAKYPERIIEHAIMGMLPKNKLRKIRMNKLKIYKGSSHPHVAQSPENLEL